MQVNKSGVSAINGQHPDSGGLSPVDLSSSLIMQAMLNRNSASEQPVVLPLKESIPRSFYTGVGSVFSLERFRVPIPELLSLDGFSEELIILPRKFPDAPEVPVSFFSASLKRKSGRRLKKKDEEGSTSRESFSSGTSSSSGSLAVLPKRALTPPPSHAYADLFGDSPNVDAVERRRLSALGLAIHPVPKKRKPSNEEFVGKLVDQVAASSLGLRKGNSQNPAALPVTDDVLFSENDDLFDFSEFPQDY